LRRDASGLDRALQDAGLKTSNNGLQFQLRDQSNNQQQGGGSSHTARIVVQDEAVPSPAIARDYGRLIGNSGGVDIHV
jgi:chemotaxis protein MotD